MYNVFHLGVRNIMIIQLNRVKFAARATVVDNNACLYTRIYVVRIYFVYIKLLPRDLHVHANIVQIIVALRASSKLSRFSQQP